MHLVDVSSCKTIEAKRPTQELSVTERTRGARSDDLFMEVWEPLEVVDERPYMEASAKCSSMIFHTHIHAVALQRINARPLGARGRADRSRRRTVCLGLLVSIYGGCGRCC